MPACRRPIEWREPFTVLSLPLGSLPNISDATIAGDHFVVIADSAFPTSPTTRDIGVLGETSARTAQRIPAPPGRFSMLFPKVALLERGSLLVIWGEAATDTATHAARGPKPRSLWMGHFANNRWADVRRIAVEGGINWDGVGASSLVMGSPSTYHLAVPAYRSGVAGFVLNLTIRDDSVALDEIRLRTEAAYASVGASASSTVVAFMAPDPGPDADVNSVWAASYRPGVSTNAPMLLSHSGQREARDPRVVVGANGIATVIWAQPFEPGSIPTALRAMRSRGDGWTALPNDIPVIPPAQLLSTFMNGDGDPTALYLNMRRSLRVARWCDGAVSDDSVAVQEGFLGSAQAQSASGTIILATTQHSVGHERPRGGAWMVSVSR